MSGEWLQHQIRPGLRFFVKGECPGIELADALARTIADHARYGESAYLWEPLADKLYKWSPDIAERGAYKAFPDAQKSAPDTNAPDADRTNA
jgi:hypothetical protein